MTMDDCFFPGSDDEVGFEEVEVAESEDKDTMYGIEYCTYFRLTFDTNAAQLQWQ